MKTATTIILFAFTALFSSCNSPSKTDDHTLSAEAFDQMITNVDDEIILDVRTPEEFAEGHIPGAVLMNVKDAAFKDRVEELDKSKTILVYCSAGVRSEKAAGILRDSGFEHVYHLQNGLKGWNETGKELTK